MISTKPKQLLDFVELLNMDERFELSYYIGWLKLIEVQLNLEAICTVSYTTDMEGTLDKVKLFPPGITSQSQASYTIYYDIDGIFNGEQGKFKCLIGNW